MAEQKTAATKPEVARAACECGCGGTPAGKKSRFIQGHDAKLHAALIAIARGTDKPAARKALARIVKLGWTPPAEPRKRAPKVKAPAIAITGNWNFGTPVTGPVAK